jgi:hypothetical protein
VFAHAADFERVLVAPLLGGVRPRSPEFQGKIRDVAPPLSSSMAEKCMRTKVENIRYYYIWDSPHETMM